MAEWSPSGHSPAAQAALQIPNSGIRESDYKPRMIGVGNAHSTWSPKKATLHHCSDTNGGFVSDATISFRKRRDLRRKRGIKDGKFHKNPTGLEAADEDDPVRIQAGLELLKKEHYEQKKHERHRRRLANMHSMGASLQDPNCPWSSNCYDKKYYTGFTWRYYADGVYTRAGQIQKRFPEKKGAAYQEHVHHELTPLNGQVNSCEAYSLFSL